MANKVAVHDPTALSLQDDSTVLGSLLGQFLTRHNGKSGHCLQPKTTLETKLGTLNTSFPTCNIASTFTNHPSVKSFLLTLLLNEGTSASVPEVKSKVSERAMRAVKQKTRKRLANIEKDASRACLCIETNNITTISPPPPSPIYFYSSRHTLHNPFTLLGAVVQLGGKKFSDLTEADGKLVASVFPQLIEMQRKCGDDAVEELMRNFEVVGEMYKAVLWLPSCMEVRD